MKRFIKAACLGSLIWTGGLSCAQAEIVVGDSLAWLVVSHDHVAIGKLVGIEPGSPNPGAAHKTFKFHVVKTLKGQPPIQTWADRYYPNDAPRVSMGTEFLLFFKDDQEVDYAINLSSPPSRGWNEVALSMDFDVFKTKKAILDAVEARLITLERERPNGFLRLSIPDEKPAYAALWSGSACFLRVPADSKFKTEFIAQLHSQDVKTRATAAYWLAKYPDQDVVEALKPLLKDPGTDVMQTFTDNQRQGVTVYPVRQAAYKTLTTWGIDVPQPTGYDPNYPSFFLE